MKIKRVLVSIVAWIIAVLLSGGLLAQSTQKFETVKVNESEKKYAASLLLEEADLGEIIKLLCDYTGARIMVVKPPAKNEKLTIEFHFTDGKEARRLVWLGKKATVKTYVTKDAEIPDLGITIVKNVNAQFDGQIHLTLGKPISVEYKDIRLADLVQNLNDLGKVKFKLAEKLVNQNIRMNLKMENFSYAEVLRALASLEDLEIVKLDESTYLIKPKKE